MEKLNNLTAQYHEQIKICEKLSREVASSGKHRTSADQSVKSIIENIDELSEENKKIAKDMKSEIRRIGDIQAHIDHHREQIAEEKREAESEKLQFITAGTKSTIHEIPESLGELVLKVGPPEAIKQERLNILRLAQAREELKHSIWSGSRRDWLNPLLFPNVQAFVPTGWARDDSTGVLRHCKNLDPRMYVDSDEHIGIVLSRIGDLEDDCSRRVLEICYDFRDPRFPGLEETLRANDHCLIRIYLGKLSTEDPTPDIAMKDAGEDAWITSAEPFLSTLNLPGYLDHMIKVFRVSHARPPLEALAREIAIGYALLHWGARLDARGIEFLMGLSPTGVGRRLYMLDFEDCRPIDELSAQCVRDQLVPAALGNDPYIPRATIWGSSDEKARYERNGKHYEFFTARSHVVRVWEVFVEQYIEASKKIWEARNHDFGLELPMIFIEELRRQNAERCLNGVSDHHVT